MDKRTRESTKQYFGCVPCNRNLDVRKYNQHMGSKLHAKAVARLEAARNPMVGDRNIVRVGGADFRMKSLGSIFEGFNGPGPLYYEEQ